MSKRKALLSWSSGKDSAWALHLLKKDLHIEVVGLLTTVNAEFKRIAMHAVRQRLLIEQAAAAGIPPWIVEIPYPCSNKEYETIMAGVLERIKLAGISVMAFGDLFLEDVRRYREGQLNGTGITPIFPLWGKDTKELAYEMQSSGVEAYVTCVDPKKLAPSFAGRRWDKDFLESLPEGVDPCGEKGEFHTFVSNGPMFKNPISVSKGMVLERDGFVFADLTSVSHTVLPYQ